MNKNCMILVDNGTEDIELVVTSDILRRAGYNIDIVSPRKVVTLSRSVTIIPDKSLDDVKNVIYDAIILPGGLKGVENLGNNQEVIQIIEKHYNENKLIAAICAAPTLLLKTRILNENFSITSHPSTKSQFKNINYLEDRVVIYNNLITSRGAGTTFEFAFSILQYFNDFDKVNKIKQDIVY